MRDYEAEYKKLSNEMLVEELHNEAYMGWLARRRHGKEDSDYPHRIYQA